MESNDNIGSDILHDLVPLIRVYTDGWVERLELAPPVPASLDPQTGVESKDIEIFPDKGIGARLFRPNPVQSPANKLPVLMFYHGGAFCVQSTFGALYHNYLNNLASQARVLIVSVEYRLAPEHPLPACYDDCWDVLNWVTSHGASESDLVASSFRPEPWLMDIADISRIFLSGDSAGGNIAHQIALGVGNHGLANGSIDHVKGIILSHPYFWGKDRTGYEVAKLSLLRNPNIVDYIWEVVCPGTSGSDDPWINPTQDPGLGKLGSERVLIFVAENDTLRDRGWLYKEALEKSEWPGKVEVVESEGENHVFHLYNPSCSSADDMMRKVVDFLNPSGSKVEA